MSQSPLSLDAAVKLILDKLAPVGSEEAPLDSSPGRTLAQDVVATADIPPWDNSSMDGYACRAADVRSATERSPVTLDVVETIAAGAFATRALASGEAMRIMTGAPVPEGSDSVVRVEDTDGGTASVSIRNGRDALANIRRRGEDVTRGETVLCAGKRVGAAEVALLAALGSAKAVVHRRPRVAILSSGDELVAVDDAADLSGARIVSANGPALAAIVNEAGGEVVDLGIVPDDLDAMTRALERARGCDLLLTSGGISVGGFDYTRRAVESAGGEVQFWRVAVRPGYNTSFGTVYGVPWIGVPGNPVSALVAGELFARPAVRRLSGSDAPLRARHRVRLAESRAGGNGVTVVMRCVLENDAVGRALARSAGAQGSAILSTSVRADALALIPPDAGRLDAGTIVEALIVRDEASV